MKFLVCCLLLGGLQEQLYKPSFEGSYNLCTHPDWLFLRTYPGFLASEFYIPWPTRRKCTLEVQGLALGGSVGFHLVSSKLCMANERPVRRALGVGLIFTWKMCVGVVESPGWKHERTEVLKKTFRFRVSPSSKTTPQWIRETWIQVEVMGSIETLLDPKLAYFSIENFLQTIFVVRFHSKGNQKRNITASTWKRLIFLS